MSRCLVEGGQFILDFFPSHWEDHAASLITDPTHFFLEKTNQLVLMNTAYVPTVSNYAWELAFRKIEDPTERARVKRWVEMKFSNFQFLAPKTKNDYKSRPDGWNPKPEQTEK